MSIETIILLERKVKALESQLSKYSNAEIPFTLTECLMPTKEGWYLCFVHDHIHLLGTEYYYTTYWFDGEDFISFDDCTEIIGYSRLPDLPKKKRLHNEVV